MIPTKQTPPVPDLPDDYLLGDLLRTGRFTVLYRAIVRSSSQAAVVKVVTIPDLQPAPLSPPPHPNLVVPLEVGHTQSGLLFAALAQYEAGSLSDRLRLRGPLRPEEAAAIGATLADALDTAHRAGAVHGDIRPAAILSDPLVGPVLSGFGFGRMHSGDGPDVVRLAHWAPELLEGAEPTPAADVYGLALTLCTLMTGAPPTAEAAGQGLAALLAHVLRHEPPRVPSWISTVLNAYLSPDPQRRPSAADLAADLRSALSGGRPKPAGAPEPSDPPVSEPPDSPSPVKPVYGVRYAVAVCAVTLAAVSAFVLLRQTSHSAQPPPAQPPAARVTQPAAPLARLDQTRYQPQNLSARPGPGRIALTWDLPPDAQSDGAGIIIRESPALVGGGTVALSRQGGLPRSYIAEPAPTGQQVCFTVGVLVERPAAGPALLQAGPTCATAR